MSGKWRNNSSVGVSMVILDGAWLLRAIDHQATIEVAEREQQLGKLIDFASTKSNINNLNGPVSTS